VKGAIIGDSTDALGSSGTSVTRCARQTKGTPSGSLKLSSGFASGLGVLKSDKARLGGEWCDRRQQQLMQSSRFRAPKYNMTTIPWSSSRRAPADPDGAKANIQVALWSGRDVPNPVDLSFGGSVCFRRRSPEFEPDTRPGCRVKASDRSEDARPVTLIPYRITF
jgi:hypothetical protein